MADMTGRERIAEIEACIQHGMAGDAMVLMREHVPWLLEQLRTAQAEITTLRARDIGWKMECDELRAVVDAARNRQRWRDREIFYEGFVLGAVLMTNYPTDKWREKMRDTSKRFPHALKDWP